MTARGVALSIDFRVDEERSSVRVRAGAGDLLAARGSLRRATLVEFRADLNRDLRAFQEVLGDELEQGDWEAVTRAVRAMFRRGKLMCSQIFGDKLVEAQEIFQKALRAPGRSLCGPAQVDVRADFHDAPPFELLPILDLSEPEWPIDSAEALAAVLDRFLGFAAIVRRIYMFKGSGGLDQNTEIDNTPRLNVKFFQHTDLAGCRNELAFLVGHHDAIEFDGPWPPNGADIDDAVATLARHLWDPTLRFDRSTASRPDHFHHFSCHCDTSADTSEQHYLLLASDRSTCQASIGDVKYQLITLGLEHGREQKPPGPIVFLNACATASVQPANISSFASLFLHDNHNRAVIGTETAVPDTVAAEFSKLFYCCLLEGRTLGESIQLAKWRLVRQYNNPVALIYTMYANPDIRVARPPVNAASGVL
jgi:hypothetical protein